MLKKCSAGHEVTTEVHSITLTVDGERNAFKLCPRHARPWLQILARQRAAAAGQPRTRVLNTISEVRKRRI